MLACCQWKIEQSRILSRSELAAVLADLTRRAKRSLNSRLNLVIVRLACCCGLRVSEITGLRVGDVRVENGRPHIRVPKHLGKGGRSREVPLWWDAGTLADITAWKELRVDQGAGPDDLIVCSMQGARLGQAALEAGVAIPLPDRMPGSRIGAPTKPDHPPRKTHLHQPRAGRRPYPGRGT